MRFLLPGARPLAFGLSSNVFERQYGTQSLHCLKFNLKILPG